MTRKIWGFSKMRGTIWVPIIRIISKYCIFGSTFGSPLFMETTILLCTQHCAYILNPTPLQNIATQASSSLGRLEQDVGMAISVPGSHLRTQQTPSFDSIIKF